MDKEVKNKLTLAQLLKEKEKFEVTHTGTEDLYIERLDATITFKKPDQSLCLESIDLSKDKDTEKGSADVHLIYNSVIEPNLKDSNLHKAFDCTEPSDIVKKIFDTGEIPAMAQEILKSVGYGSHVERVKTVKN